MEMCTGGSLVSRMRDHRHGYGERAAATLVEKMLSAVTYCHRHSVIHRDIKLDNFIYEDDREDAELKLIDFGFACEVAPGHEDMFERLGTLSYMAPELVSSNRHKARPTPHYLSFVPRLVFIIQVSHHVHVAGVRLERRHVGDRRGHVHAAVRQAPVPPRRPEDQDEDHPE